jgi:hypothetical protein
MIMNKFNKMFERIVNNETQKIKSHIEKNSAKYFLMCNEMNNRKISKILKNLKIDTQEKIQPFQFYDGMYVKNEKFEKEYHLFDIMESIFVQPNENYCKIFLITGDRDYFEFSSLNHLELGSISTEDLEFLRKSSHLGL